MWHIIVQGAAAAYLAWLGTCIKTENLKSSVVFKFIPFAIAVPLALGAAAQLLGWPI